MNKLKVEIIDRPPNLSPVAMKDIPIGTVFFAAMAGDLRGGKDVYLRVFSGVVGLSHPERTWTGDAYDDMTIDYYLPATFAKLTVA